MAGVICHCRQATSELSRSCVVCGSGQRKWCTRGVCCASPPNSHPSELPVIHLGPQTLSALPLILTIRIPICFLVCFSRLGAKKTESDPSLATPNASHLSERVEGLFAY